MLGDGVDPRVHGQFFPDQPPGEQHRGDAPLAGLVDEAPEVLFERGHQCVAHRPLDDRVAPLLDLLDVAAHAEAVDPVLDVRVRDGAPAERVVHAGHRFEQCGRGLVESALGLEEIPVAVHRFGAHPGLPLRVVREDGGRDDVGLVVVRPHAVVRVLQRAGSDGQLAVVDDDVEGGDVVRVTEVRWRVGEDLAQGGALAAQGVATLRDPRSEVVAHGVDPFRGEELETVRVPDGRRGALGQGPQGRAPGLGRAGVHPRLLNPRLRLPARPMRPCPRPCTGPETGSASPWRSP